MEESKESSASPNFNCFQDLPFRINLLNKLLYAISVNVPNFTSIKIKQTAPFLANYFISISYKFTIIN
jgi:hypothetical protein